MHISILADAFAAEGGRTAGPHRSAGIVHRDSALRALIVLGIVALFTGLLMVSNEADAARDIASPAIEHITR